MNKDKITPIDDSVECIEALAKIVKENELSKIKISTEDIDIVIEGKRCFHPHGAPHGMPPMPGMPMNMPAPPMNMPGAPLPVPNAAPSEEKGKFITAKIIGTFYACPAPEKPPFVRVGDMIKEGDVVCIIESMKLMNEVISEVSGRVAEIYPNDGETVEFGQKLIRVE